MDEKEHHHQKHRRVASIQIISHIDKIKSKRRKKE